MSFFSTVAQGAASLANAWYVKLTDGTNTLGTASHPVRTDTTGTTAQPVSATALPLPTGAATESTLSAVNGKVPALGAAAKAASVPVTMATDQPAIAVTMATAPTTDVMLKDEYGWGVEFTPMDEMRVVEPVRLVGATFVGTTIDPNFWTAATASGGTVAQANAQIVLTCGTNSAGAASLVSIKTARYIGGSCNRFRGVVQLSDAGLADNTRRWGAANAGLTDGAYFKLAGTTLSIATRKGGAETAVASAAWNGSTTVPTLTNANTYEIYFTNSKVYFVINGTLMHTVSATAATWSSTLTLNAFADITNSGNTTTANVEARSLTISRLGRLDTETRYFHGTTAATTVLKYGPGTLHRVIINQSSGTLITIVDNVTGSTPVIAVIGAPAAAGPSALPYETAFNTGLTVISTGTWDYTVVYE